MVVSIDAPFDGDGRFNINPTCVLPGTKPRTLARSMAREIIHSLIRTGHSTHSSDGAVLWVVLAWLQHQRKPYLLTAHPTLGYMVQLVTPSFPGEGVSFAEQPMAPYERLPHEQPGPNP